MGDPADVSSSKSKHQGFFMHARSFIATSIMAFATSHSFADSVSANASAGFQSAQLTNSQSFSSTCSYPAPTYLPVCTAAPQQSATAGSKFNFNGQAAQASAQVAGPGLLHASASLSSGSPPFDTLTSSSNTSFNDELTFNVAGLSGQSVLVFMKYSISGTGSFTQDAYQSGSYASAYLNFGLGGGSSYLSAYAAPGYIDGFFKPGFQYTGYRVFSAVVGKAEGLYLSLSANCYGGLSTVGGFSCSSDATASYRGISGLALPNGTAITNYSVSSVSGYDYINAAAPVPEPASGLMLLIGLSAIGAFRLSVQAKNKSRKTC